MARVLVADALASESAAAPEESEETAPVSAMEGPADEPATFPGGLTARITSVTAQPADLEIYSGDPAFDTLVTVTVEMTPWNNETYPLEGFNVVEDLQYGANLYTAQGWMTEGGSGELPKQVTPGTTVTTISEHTLPGTELGELSFEFSPSSQYEEPWMFTDIEELLAD